MANNDNNKRPARIMGRPGGGPMAMHREKPPKLKDIKGTTKRLLKYLKSKRVIFAIVILLSLITTLINIIGTRLNGYTVDNFIETGDMRGLAIVCIVLIILYIISVCSTYSQNSLMINVAQKISAEIRSELFSSVQQLPLKYYDTHSSGDLMSRLTNDIDNISGTLSQSVIHLFSSVISIVGMLIAMVFLSPLLTLIALLTTPLMFLTTRYIAKKTQPIFINQQKELGNLNGYIEEMISGQKAVLLFSREEKVKEEFGEINKRLTKNAILAQGFSGIMGPLNNFINNFTYLIIAVSGGFFILKGMNLTVGGIFAFLLYMRNFTRPINEILNMFNTIQSALAGAERVFEVMDEEKEVDEDNATEILNIKGEVSFNNVSFSYDKEKTVLKNATFSADKGKVIAIVGPTGAGKTTIINLLPKFYDIDSGEINIDGKNIRSLTRNSLRKSISIVLQDTFLFSETIRENIRYGNIKASDEEVEKAAKMANAHSFIKQLSKGYDTILSDNGGNISQGQRQLIAIARAILADASILILDEATSSIDTRTEIKIQNAMLKLMEGKTTFVIAHRLSTIKNADEILVVKDGEIIERGNHEELLNSMGFYSELYNSQFKTGMSI